jgi:hypothetical protein
MSQQALADFAGLSQPYAWQVESGRRSIERRATLTALAAALQVSVAELLGHAQPGDPARDQARAYVPAIREALITWPGRCPAESGRGAETGRPGVAGGGRVRVGQLAAGGGRQPRRSGRLTLAAERSGTVRGPGQAERSRPTAP